MLAPQFVGATVDSSVASESGQLPDRRQTHRQRLRDAVGTLEWREGEEQISCSVKVVDISGAGAAVVAERAPEVGQTVWLLMKSDAAGSERLEARVVTTSVEAPAEHIVRLQFMTWLPLGDLLERYEEHRLWQRYPARETRARLVWLDHTGELAAPGKLLNISGGGGGCYHRRRTARKRTDLACARAWMRVDGDGRMSARGDVDRRIGIPRRAVQICRRVSDGFI